MRKVYLRLLPFSILCVFVCYLDRVNVGFAALTMNRDLGFSAASCRRGLPHPPRNETRLVSSRVIAPTGPGSANGPWLKAYGVA